MLLSVRRFYWSALCLYVSCRWGIRCWFWTAVVSGRKWLWSLHYTPSTCLRGWASRRRPRCQSITLLLTWCSLTSAICVPTRVCSSTWLQVCEWVWDGCVIQGVGYLAICSCWCSLDSFLLHIFNNLSLYFVSCINTSVCVGVVMCCSCSTGPFEGTRMYSVFRLAHVHKAFMSNQAGVCSCARVFLVDLWQWIVGCLNKRLQGPRASRRCFCMQE